MKRLGLDSAIVFGLAYAASLHACRAAEGRVSRVGLMPPERLLTPSVDAIQAVRQWLHTREAEADDDAPWRDE